MNTITTIVAAATSPITSGASRWVITSVPATPMPRATSPNRIVHAAPRAAFCETDIDPAIYYGTWSGREGRGARARGA